MNPTSANRDSDQKIGDCPGFSVIGRVSKWYHHAPRGEESDPWLCRNCFHLVAMSHLDLDEPVCYLRHSNEMDRFDRGILGCFGILVVGIAVTVACVVISELNSLSGQCGAMSNRNKTTAARERANLVINAIEQFRHANGSFPPDLSYLKEQFQPPPSGLEWGYTHRNDDFAISFFCENDAGQYPVQFYNSKTGYWAFDY